MKYISFFIFALALTKPSVSFSGEGFPDQYTKNQEDLAKKGITVSTENLKEGEHISVEFLGRPVFIYKRTKGEIEETNKQKTNEELKLDPTSIAKSEYKSSSSEVWARLVLEGEFLTRNIRFRSTNEKFFVVAGWSPENGCALRRSSKNNESSSSTWEDPCSASTYNSTGHVLRLGKEALGKTLLIPPHIAFDNAVIIGTIAKKPLPKLPFDKKELYNTKTPTSTLISAASFNDMETIKSALQNGANINHYMPRVGSPIDAAITGSSSEIVELLVKSGATPTQNTDLIIRMLGREDLLPIVLPQK